MPILQKQESPSQSIPQMRVKKNGLGIGPITPRLLGLSVEEQNAAAGRRRVRPGSDVRGGAGAHHQDDRVLQGGGGLFHAQVI